MKLSDEETTLLLDPREDKHEDRKALLERIAAESLIAAAPEDAAAAQALYDAHKIEGASLIAVDLSLPEGTGIINCRVGDEHKQIRF